MLVECASKGGNLILNVGPDARGIIPGKSVDILTEVGKWMDKNGESIYGCTMSGLPKPEWGRITRCGKTFYLHIMDCNTDTLVVENFKYKVKAVTRLDDDSLISTADPWNRESYEGEDLLFIHVPPFNTFDEIDTVIKIETE
jgi:alpha-L-fucosidase